MKTRSVVLSAALLSAVSFGCGGEREIALKPVSAAAAVPQGPPATKEEMSGEVPVLRGLTDARVLVPPELIPPEAPADPNPGFEAPQ